MLKHRKSTANPHRALSRIQNRRDLGRIAFWSAAVFHILQTKKL
jgi:hypothetical protein